MSRAAALLGLAVSLLSATGQTVPISDPAAFVTETYRHFTASQHGSDYDPPENIYTPRLKALFAEDERRSGGEVGCIDFEFWVDGQDYELKNVRVQAREVAGHKDRRLVIATFENLGHATELHFDFQQAPNGWLLDDVHSVKGKNQWSLSKILMCWKH